MWFNNITISSLEGTKEISPKYWFRPGIQMINDQSKKDFRPLCLKCGRWAGSDYHVYCLFMLPYLLQPALRTAESYPRVNTAPIGYFRVLLWSVLDCNQRRMCFTTVACTHLVSLGSTETLSPWNARRSSLPFTSLVGDEDLFVF